MKESQAIVQLEYMKQAMQRASYKMFYQITNEIPLIFHLSIKQMWTVLPIRHCYLTLKC